MHSLPSTGRDKMRVLVVEDEAVIAEEIRDRLCRLSLDVVGIAANGKQAIATAQASNPDLVLMDIRLQGDLDGIETAELIRQQIDVPIIYLTAYSDQATLARARETAPLGYVLKPVHERELEVTIEMAMHRHRLERRLRESEGRYAATLASIGDAVLATDQAGCVTFMNTVAEALMGWTSVSAAGQPVDRVFSLLDEQTGLPLENPILTALATSQTVHLRCPALLVARDGSRIPIDDSAAPIIDAQGRVLGVVVAFHDIRDRRLAEDALNKAETELRRAQKMESIGQLAGGVAHDFNNFLTAINGYCELLIQSGDLRSENADLVRQIVKASERSAQLTRQLLAFSRQQPVSPEILNLNHLVTGAEQLLRRLIGGQIDIRVMLAPDVAPVRADPGQIEQIIMNLAVNARDAMPRGGTLLIETANYISRGSADAPPILPLGHFVRLTVSDSGEGMSEAVKARLFEPFFTTKAPGKGTGLGLATVYGIVKLSGGLIDVISELDRGSTFNVFLPAVDSAGGAGVPQGGLKN